MESVLGELQVNSREVIDHRLGQEGRKYLEILRRTKAHLWNGQTYRMMSLRSHPSLSMECGLGEYFSALISCDSLEFELLTSFARRRPEPFEFPGFKQSLNLRQTIHSWGDPIVSGRGRSAAIAISTLIVFLEDGQFKALLKVRSPIVAVHSDLLHVVPSFMFQPIVGRPAEEFSVKHNIYREYLEELFERPELERPGGQYGHDFFYEDDNLRYLRMLEEGGKATFYLTGVCVNLLNLRPEICTLLLITDPAWVYNQRRGAKLGDLQLRPMTINHEFRHDDQLDKGLSGGRAALQLTSDMVLPRSLFKPANFVPPAAAALKLGLDVAREEIARNGIPS